MDHPSHTNTFYHIVNNVQGALSTFILFLALTYSKEPILSSEVIVKALVDIMLGTPLEHVLWFPYSLVLPQIVILINEARTPLVYSCMP